MKALVIGGSGQVGSALAEVLEARGHEVGRTYHHHESPGAIPFDITKDWAPRMLAQEKPDVIFCPAGATHVDRCEEDPQYSHELNVEGPVTLARAALPFRARFIFFSSEYVFGEGEGPFSEDFEASPKSVYGMNKFEAEHWLREVSGSLVIRTTVVYGKEPQEKNTVYQLLKAFKEGKKFRAASDQLTTPTFNLDLAEAAVVLAERGSSGLFHIAGPQRLSRYDFLLEACRVFGLDPKKVVPVKTADMNLKAPRHLEAGLDSSKLREEIEIELRSPAEGLEKMKAQLLDGSEKKS